MAYIRYHFITLLFLWPLMVIAQSHDFEVRDFHENITDLSAVRYNVRDINGGVTALIRFAVRDTLFSFEANNGIISRVNGVGEILLFVPTTTRRITIKHPRLGILRDYQPPVAIKSKTTYDAEIVITNPGTLRKEDEYNPPRKKDDLYPDNTNVPNVPDYPVYEDHGSGYSEPQNPYKREKIYVMPETHFLIGAGFNALSVMGPSLSIGLEIGNFFIGADYVYGIDKVKDIGINYKRGSQTTLGEAYDYSSSRASLRLGLNFMTESAFQVVPQIGASMSMISGSAISDVKGKDTQFEKSNVISAFLALSLRARLGESFLVHVTPQYDLAVGADDVFKVIKEADSKIKAWGEGFGVSAGLLIRF